MNAQRTGNNNDLNAFDDNIIITRAGERMVKGKNLILVLAILLVMFSVLGSLIVLENTVLNAPRGTSTQQGEVKLNILPNRDSSSTTGYIGLKVVPGEK